jgi:hypothetical protein
MGCNCGNKKKPNVFSKAKNIVDNLTQSFVEQPDKLKWFKSGVNGILKCVGEKVIYIDEEIQKNRDICRGCEFATKTDGKLTKTSQCMGPDPNKNGAPCGCFILCKTQVDPRCPLGKWGKFSDLTINGVSSSV